MANDFIHIGGVKFLVQPESWEETRLQVGDIADSGDGIAMSGRPIESRAAIVRQWKGSTLRDAPAKDSIPQASNPKHFENMIRWVEGWGQLFPLLTNVYSGAGVALTPATSFAGGAISSGLNLALQTQYTMRVRRGFVETAPMGWSLGFKKTFAAGEAPFIAGSHWCVATGAVVYALASGNPAGVTQYVDGVASNFNVGNLSDNGGSSAGTFRLYGKLTTGTNANVTYSDFFFVPFQIPATWVLQIYTNLISAGRTFPVLPRQKLDGQWLSIESAPVEAIGRVLTIHQRVGTPAKQTWQNDLRELDLQLTEF